MATNKNDDLDEEQDRGGFTKEHSTCSTRALPPSVPLIRWKGSFAGRDDKRVGGRGLWEGEIGGVGHGSGCGPPYSIVRPPVLQMQSGGRAGWG